MNDRINKPAICSIVSLDIIDYSKKTDSEQVEIKNKLNSLINHAVMDIVQDERTIRDTSDGAAIACNGQLEDALEDALFISLTIRDEILKENTHSSMPLYVRIGINLGSVRVVNDINGQQNIVGDGIDVARQIMSFAKPNQILVSRSYYEVTSKLSQEIAQMFEYHDMHAHEHEIYAVRLLKDHAAIEEFPSISTDNLQPSKWQLIAGKVNWKYTVISLLVIVALYVLVKLVSTPSEPMITLEQPQPPVATQAEPKEMTHVKNAASKAKKSVPKSGTTNQTETKPKPDETKQTASKPDESKDKSIWDKFKDTVKQGTTQHQCTQAEIAMGQCR